jgi:uncharacterized glyoxalase superfamily protein PhnB
MQNSSLPARPNLEQYKKIAKEIVKAWKENSPTMIPWEGSVVTVTREHLRQLHPRLRQLPEAEAITEELSLADAQFMVARHYGFENWAEFASTVETRRIEVGGMEMKLADRKVVHTRHVLAVKSLEIAGNYFRDKLGFELEFTAPGWEFLSFGEFKLMIGECTDEVSATETGNHSYFAHCLVENVDDVYAELRARGAKFTQPVGDKPWGVREFSVVTPDGHRITYGQMI